MPEFLTQIQIKVGEFWRNLDKSQKNRIYIISVIIAVAISIGFYIATRPNYLTLITGANPKEISEMRKVLTDNNIWSDIKDNGTSIVVNMKDSDDAHYQLGVAGYPKEGMTFDDAFKSLKLSNTESDKKQLWQNFKKTSLIAQLKKFENVNDATVDLTWPEKSPFIFDKEQEKPKAYVRVNPKGELTPKQVEGIVMIISRSVEGLSPEDVTVVDNNLNILNNDSSDDSINRASSQEDLRIKRAKELEKKVFSLYGGLTDNYDNLRVVANPILDFNKQKSTISDIAIPEGMTEGAPISKETSVKKLTNDGTGGATAMDVNPGTGTVPSYPTATGSGSKYDESNAKTNLDYTRSQTETEKSIGDMLVDKSSLAMTLLYGNKVTDEGKMSQVFIDDLIKGVSKATGVPANNISVTKLKIAPPEVQIEPVSEKVRKLFDTYGFFALMVLLIIGLMIAAIPRKKTEEFDDETISLTPATASGPRFIVPEQMVEEIPEIALEERSEIKKQIDKFVKQKPDAVAQLLRNWLSDEWD